MAKINFVFDTESKTVMLDIDGKPVDNFRSMSVYQSYDDKDEYQISMTTMTEDEETDIRTYTQMCASERASASFPGLIETTKKRAKPDELGAAIAAMFGRKE